MSTQGSDYRQLPNYNIYSGNYSYSKQESDPRYFEYKGSIERQEKLIWLGPILLFIFSFFFLGIKITIPYTIFLRKRLLGVLLSAVICIVYFFYNRYQIKLDKIALAEYQATRQIPRRLHENSYQRKNQIFSVVAMLLILAAGSLLQGTSRLAPEKLADAPYLFHNESALAGDIGEMAVYNNFGFVVPRQYQAFISFEENSGTEAEIQDSMTLDMYGFRSEKMASGFFSQLDKRAEEYAGTRDSKEFTRAYSTLSLADREDLLLKVESGKRAEEDRPYIHILLQDGTEVVTVTYFGGRSLEEVLDYTLALFP